MSRATQEYKQESSSFRVRGHYPLGRRFPATSAIKTIDNSFRTSTKLTSYNPAFRRKRFGLFPFRSPLLGVSRESRSIQTNIRLNGTRLILFSFPPGTEMFHFPGFASCKRYLADYSSKLQGFPIRTSPDQRLQTASPKLFAG